MLDYHDLGVQTYGTRCEWVGCGWDAANVDVHHIAYQEHQRLEDGLRIGPYNDEYQELLAEARQAGLTYTTRTRQLSKDNRSTNLSVLCPNHHRYLHEKDLGLQVLNFIPARK